MSKEMEYRLLREKLVLSALLLPMINSSTILSNMSFHNLLVYCPCWRQVRAREVATHQRLLTFGRDFASRSILKPKYRVPDDLFSILTKVWWGKGPSNVSI
jgi:hypothetical protein